MKWKIAENDEVFEDVDNLAEWIIDDNYYNRDDFDKYLNDSYDCTSIEGYDFSPLTILYELGNGAYYTAFDNWKIDQLEDKRSDVRSELLGMNPGETSEIEGYDIECFDEDMAESFDTMINEILK